MANGVLSRISAMLTFAMESPTGHQSAPDVVPKNIAPAFVVTVDKINSFATQRRLSDPLGQPAALSMIDQEQP